MPIRMNKPGESSFDINIDNTFDPLDDHTIELVDMDEYQGISKIDGKPYTSIKWIFRIFDENGVTFTNLIDDSVYETWQFTSKSLAPKANARAWAAALLGKTELSDVECDELSENFDSALVGKRATASWKVEEDKTTGNKRLKVALMRPLRKARRQAPAAAAEPVQAPTPRNGAASRAATRESAAERRAKLEAELAGLTDEDTGSDDDIPF
jgi:hypothetical protein